MSRTKEDAQKLADSLHFPSQLRARQWENRARKAQRERDEARAQRDKLAEALRDVMWWRDTHPMNPEPMRAEENAREALAELEKE